MTGLRERNKQAVRSALRAAALELMRKDGFDATPIEAIAAAAGVSRRSFFRYFPSKEAVVFEGYAERLARFREIARPQPGDSTALASVRRACLSIAREYSAERSAMLQQQRLVHSSAALVAYELELDRGWIAALEEALSRDHSPLEARLLAGATMGVIRAVLTAWFDSRGRTDIVRLGRRGFRILERGTKVENGRKP